MTQTLDQQRAAFAWQAATQGIGRHHEDYRRLAKGAPALIMTSGLMPTLAFYAGKGNAADLLTDDIVRWLSERIWRQTLQPGQGTHLFPSLMERIQTGDSATYLRATDEALEILKWIRQFVDAVQN
jgi:CRISPR-associated protein Cmr5